MRREMVDAYPPPFSRVTHISSLDSGEPGDSSLNPGFDRKGKIAIMSGNSKRLSGEILVCFRFEIRADNG